MLQLTCSLLFILLPGFSVDCVECLWMTTLNPNVQALLDEVFVHGDYFIDRCVVNPNATGVVKCAAGQTCLMYGGEMSGTYYDPFIVGK